MQTNTFEEQIQLLALRSSALLDIVNCEITHKDSSLLTVQGPMQTNWRESVQAVARGHSVVRNTA